MVKNLKNIGGGNTSIDPCSIGPLTCGLHPQDMGEENDDYNVRTNNEYDSPREDDEEEEEKKDNLTSLWAVAAQKGRASWQSAFRSSSNSHNQNVYKQQSYADDDDDDDDDLVEVTKERILDFQNRGWLSQQETRKYMAILNTAPPMEKGNKEHFEDFIRNQIIQELDRLETKMTSATPASSVGGGSFASSSRPTNLTPVRPLGDASSKLNSRRKSEVVMSAKDVAKQIGDDQIEELFVETCFFARLGFVQPPSCLKCAYRQSIKGDGTTAKCNRWVAWRRDANFIIHPSYLMENTVFVQCQAVRHLLKGQAVDAHQWDASKKELLFPHQSHHH
jgi:hypothetical protein